MADFYRGGEMSLSAVRRLGVLVRELPARSRLATALNGGQPVFGLTESLLADIWVVLVRANSPKDSLPKDFDHPLRVEARNRVALARIQQLKDKYEHRKRRRNARRG